MTALFEGARTTVAVGDDSGYHADPAFAARLAAALGVASADLQLTVTLAPAKTAPGP